MADNKEPDKNQTIRISWSQMMQPISKPDPDHLVLDFKAMFCAKPSVTIISGDADTVQELMKEVMKLAPESIVYEWPDHVCLEMNLELLQKVYHPLWDAAYELGWFPSMWDDDRGPTIHGRVWFIRMKKPTRP